VKYESTATDPGVVVHDSTTNNLGFDNTREWQSWPDWLYSLLFCEITLRLCRLFIFIHALERLILVLRSFTKIVQLL